MRPTAATAAAYGAMTDNDSMPTGTFGMLKIGRVPLMAAMSPMVLVLRPRVCVRPVTMPMAARGAGRALVMRGRTAMIAIVNPVRPAMIASGVPDSNTACPAALTVWKCSNWADRMTMARPLTKPSIAARGTRRMSLPSLAAPKAICRTPAIAMHAKRYCGPWLATREPVTTAVAPAAPEIIPGRPPSRDTTPHMRMAPCKPTSG
mmetsp:Transcript_10941/g.30934  ORF Transcript_10941/g.30934 Transcript_10941/m.30934 type:complete len:205 (-) Transcript_10941:648-1262(-)